MTVMEDTRVSGNPEFPQPADAPAVVACQQCGHDGPSADMKYIPPLTWWCRDTAACARRWEAGVYEPQHAQASAEQPETDAEPQDDNAETDAGEADSPAGEPETATEDEGTSDDAGPTETAQDASE